MATRSTLNVSLTPELDAFVAQAVKSGLYLSSSEVVREALRDLQLRWEVRQHAVRKLNADIAIGMGQIERGEVEDGEVVMKRLQEKIDRYKAEHA